MKISFSENDWHSGELVYAYSYRFEETPVFLQKPDCIENRANPGAAYGFDNISLLTPATYGPGVTIRARCAFEDLGAPLLVLSPWMETDSRGVNRYGDYIEVVLWKNGVNVWRMWYRNGEVTWKQLLGVDFPVSEGEIHEIGVTVGTDTLEITADGRRMLLGVEGLYPTFHVGLNACEGINRFYTFETSAAASFGKNG